MAAGDYKAGTAWLEIVPSFKGIEGAIAGEVEKAARQVDSAMAASIPDGIRRSAENARKEARRVGEQSGEELAFGMSRKLREAEKGIFKGVDEHAKKEMGAAGEKGGLEFAGAFKKALRSRSGQVMGAIPKVDITPDMKPFDAELARARNAVSTLDRAFMKSRISEPALFNGLEGQRNRLNGLLGQATKHEDFHNARTALNELNELESMFRNMRTAGLHAKGAYGGAFDSRARDTLRSMLNDLPEVNPNSKKKSLRELRDLRSDMENLQTVRIGVDMDLGKFLVRMAEVEQRLRQLGDKRVELKYDTDKALAKVGKLFDDILPSKAEEAGPKVGNKAGDAFNKSFAERIGKAATALPDIKINADSSDAHLEIAAVKKQLKELGDEEIGVSIHEDIAIAQIEDMKRRLEEVAKSDPSVQVKADVAEAIAQMDEVLIKAGRLERSDPKVKVKVDVDKNNIDQAENSLLALAQAAGVGGSRLAMLASLGAAIGSILVPAAGAAAVAVSGLAQAAGAAVAGVGVFALGISGLGGAITSLNKYEDDQAKSAASLGRSQEMVAGAIDRVESSERSLANTRENVADGARRASKAVIDAERGVTDATKARQKAVEELQQAYEDARKENEDRALAMRSTELAQRKAALDLADAKKKLDEVMANPQATAAEREEVKIAYEEQVLQIDELSVKQKRLKEEQAQANKVGVDGSKQVVAARERVQQADENIAKSQERLAEAIQAQQRQQREGAFQIAQATQAVANAQRGLEKATMSAGVAGGEALDNLKWSMQQLGPAGTSFAKFIFSLKQDFLELRQTAQSAMLPGLQIAIQQLTTYLPRIKRFVGEVAAALGGIFIEMTQELQHPSWQKFFGWIADTAVPTLQGMYRFTMLVARGLADLFMALSPFNSQMGSGLMNWAQSFADWAQTLSSTHGFREFLDYVSVNGPKVMELLGEMSHFIFRILTAAAPIGAQMLDLFIGLFKWLNSLPIEHIETFVKVLAIFYTTMLAIGGVAKILYLIGAAFTVFSRTQTKVWGGMTSLVRSYRGELAKLNNTAIRPGTGTPPAGPPAPRPFGFGPTPPPIPTPAPGPDTTRNVGMLNAITNTAAKSMGAFATMTRNLATNMAMSTTASGIMSRAMGTVNRTLSTSALGVATVSTRLDGMAGRLREAGTRSGTTGRSLGLLNTVTTAGSKAMDSLGNTARNASMRLALATTNADGSATRFTGLNRVLGASATGMANLANSLTYGATRMRYLGTEGSNTGRGLGVLNGVTNTAAKGVSGLSDAARNMALRMSLATTEGGATSRALGGLHGVVNNVAGRIASLSGAAQTLAGRLQNVGTGAGGAGTAVNGFNKFLAGGLVAADTMKKGLSSVVNFLGGPLGVAFVGAAVVAGAYFQHQQKIENQAKDMKGALESIAQAYEEGGDAAVSAMARTNGAVRDTLSMLLQYGVSARQIFLAEAGSKTAQSSVVDALQKEMDRLNGMLSQDKDSRSWMGMLFGSNPDTKAPKDVVERIQAIGNLIPKMREQWELQKAMAAAEEEAERSGLLVTARLESIKNALENANPKAKDFETALRSLGEIGGDTTDKLDGYLALSDKIAQSNLSASEKASLFRTVLDQVGESATTSGPTFDALTGVFNGIADSALNASDKTSLLKQAMDQMYQASIDQVEADERLARSKVDLSTQLQTNSAGFDLNSESGQKNTDAVLRNRDALEGALTASRDKYIADLVAAQGADDVALATENARKAHEDRTTAIVNQIDPTHRNSEAVQELVTKYGSIPKDVSTKFTTDESFKQLYNQLRMVSFMQQAIKDGDTPERAKARWDAQMKWESGFIGPIYIPSKAEGGLLEGPWMGPKADNILIRANPREFVHQVAAVDYYGVDFMNSLNQMQIPKEMLPGNAPVRMPHDHLPGYAQGGMVQWPFKVALPAGSFSPNINQALNYIFGSFTGGGWPPSPMAQRGDSGVWRSIVGLINSTGPLSGAFSNAYRPGDPLWHGSGRAVDWMGFNQDALASFLAAHNPLELIHRTSKRDYAYTRGKNMGSFDNQLMEEHRNHIHIAMANGGLVGAQLPMLFDKGGRLPAGLGAYLNATGTPENVLTDNQWNAVFELARRPAQAQAGNTYQFEFRDTDLTESRLRAMQAADALRARYGRAR